MSSDLWRECNERDAEAYLFGGQGVIPVEPVTFVTVDREGGAITYDSTDLFDLPSGRYGIFPLGADDE